MCRRYLVAAASLIAFGAGVLVGGWVESGLLRFLIALATICGGMMLAGGNCRHK